MKFVLFHGSFGDPNENWLPDLRQDLEALGQTVLVPKFPVEDWDEIVKNGPTGQIKHQSLDSWLMVFEKEVLPVLKGNDKIIFVGHSLAPVFILHVVSKFKLPLECAIFVSPFMDALDRWEFNLVNTTFYKTDFDFEELKKLIPVSYVLYSDNDPFVTNNHSLLFAKALESSTILVHTAGHMNASVNLNEFPLVRDLCYSRLDLSLYQKFLDHYKKISAQGYITTKKDSGILKIKPEEVIDEGIFHFRHLSKHGFCTLYTGIQKFWDPESTYMMYGREAARRTKQFTRVIVVSDPSDLHSPVLKKQVKLDLEAGVHLYKVSWDDIKDVVKEPDFGVWDDSYVCVVRVDPKTNTVREAELNSRIEDMNIYEKWQTYILQKAKKIHSVTDLVKI
jgi:predicted alpha/beta hydrolase family esterase